MHVNLAAVSVLTTLSLALAAPIPLEKRGGLSMADAVAAAKTSNTDGIPSSIVDAVANGLGLDTLQGGIVETVAMGLKAGGL